MWSRRARVALVLLTTGCAGTAPSPVARSSPRAPSSVRSDLAVTDAASSYTAEIRKAVLRHWHPEAVPGADRGVAGISERFVRRDDNRRTVLDVILDANGVLRHVSVAESSGIEALDRAAVEAVREAEPFESPPPELLAKKTKQFRFDIGFRFERGTPVVQELLEMPSTAEARAARRPRAFRVRAYVDEAYRARVPNWRERIAAQIEDASVVTEDEFGARLELESIRPWEQTVGDALDGALDLLIRHDPAFEVDWVVGFVGPSHALGNGPDYVGRARFFGRHFVVRAVDSVAPQTLFLHEWAHTLGAVHDCAGSWTMLPTYGVMRSSFSPESAWLIRLGLEHRDVSGEASHRDWAATYGGAARRIEAAGPACAAISKELRRSEWLLFMASRAYLTFEAPADGGPPDGSAEQWATTMYESVRARLDGIADALRRSLPRTPGERSTVVSISLDSTGAVTQVRVELGSGYAPFDDAVVEAIRAQRFPSPPAEFSTGDRTYGFTTSFLMR
jgi:TonB family protein